MNPPYPPASETFPPALGDLDRVESGRWLIALPYLTPPLSLNNRHRPRVHAAITKRVRRDGMLLAKAHHIPALGACRVTLTWYVNTHHRRDADNIVATLKPLCDGLVDAGIVEDDIPALMDKPTPKIVYRAGQPAALTLLVEQTAPRGPVPPSAGTTLYIAGPMAGLPANNYPAFHAAADELRASGFRVLNPVDNEQHNPGGEQQAWEWWMRHALRMMLDADGIALLPGAQNSRGAALERHVAEALAMPVRHLDEWIEAAA